MSIALTLAVTAGFIWSTLLFFASVFVREREQEAGFGWALIGALLFAVVFADRLPGHPTGPREIIKILPNLPSGGEMFTSSLVVLVALFVIYLFRVAVFYQLFLKDGTASSGTNEHEDVVNDVVAPALSYLCFAICLVTLLQESYRATFFVTVLIAAAVIGAHYVTVLRILIRYFGDIATAVRVLTARLRIALNRFVLGLVVLIAWVEGFRREDADGALSKWAEQRRRGLDAAKLEARVREKELIARAAKRVKPKPTRRGAR